MSLLRIVRKLVLCAATVFALAGTAATVNADGGICLSCGSSSGACGAGGCCSQNGCCPGGPCPAPLVHCTPKPPKIKFKCVCGKPICDPCDLEGYGYNPTCWRPWTPPLSCGNGPFPALGCPPPLAHAVSPYPTAAGDVLPAPIKPNSDTQRLPKKIPGELLPQGDR